MNDKCVVLNAKKMNFDGKLDFSVLSSDVTVYDDTTKEQLSERIQGADIIVTKEMSVSAEMIQKFPESVKLICEAGTGYNNIDLEAARKKGITVCNIPAYSTERVAHTAIMMILNLSSAMQVQMKMLACGNHDNFTRNLQVPHVEVNGKTLGVIGAGHIGRKVIQIAQALDMNILVYTRTPREDEKGIRYVSLEELLRNSDYVSMHCPLTESTKHMINKETLSLMKPSAFIINTSRGALIDEAALIEALENGTIAGAGLDVQETEPPEETNPLYTMDQVLLTPHMGWKGLETRQRLVSILADNIKKLGTPDFDDKLPLLLNVPRPYWEFANAYKPVEVASKLTLPMLILQGERDYQVTMQDFGLWRFGLLRNKNAFFKSYPKLNHMLQEGSGKATPFEYNQASPVVGYVMDDIVSFIHNGSLL